MNNCKEFLDRIAMNYNIKTTNDWNRISNSLIKNKGGYVASI